MRGFLVPVLILLIGGAVTILLILWLRQRVGRTGTGPADLDRVLATRGAARCIAATLLLEALARRGDQDAIVRTWERLELPLLEALPDCPPDYKRPLVDALDGCVRVCQVVAVSRSMMDLRNSLLG